MSNEQVATQVDMGEEQICAPGVATFEAGGGLGGSACGSCSQRRTGFDRRERADHLAMSRMGRAARALATAERRLPKDRPGVPCLNWASVLPGQDPGELRVGTRRVARSCLPLVSTSSVR